MNKKFLKENLLWIIIIIVIIIFLIYYYYFCTDNNLNRKKLNRKHLISKKIYESPFEIKKSLKKKLQKKLNKVAENFDNNKYIIKLFFADWCPHCVDFKPIWYSLKKKYSNNISFIEVDCTENDPELSFIKGFPTIAIFDGTNNFIDVYNGDRSNKSFEAYIKDNLLNN